MGDIPADIDFHAGEKTADCRISGYVTHEEKEDKGKDYPTSLLVSELIANELKPHAEGEFTKGCKIAAGELLVPEEAELFLRVSLSRRTICNRIDYMAKEIERTPTNYARDFLFFSLACDETTEITNIAQRCIFIRGVTADFETREELLSLEPMHDTTAERLKSSMNRFGLIFEKLSGLVADGAPAMVS
ncbi:general transcription factor II-I repeat domain-containing protein 2-like [Palaemon carinicauda]|uniref:general transcription factor II-I repeat domain-containing protein 2-like n=1 Tax=Palaemon carinicauda TaxID=392227 RepID=UPI0035B5780E